MILYKAYEKKNNRFSCNDKIVKINLTNSKKKEKETGTKKDKNARIKQTSEMAAEHKGSIGM